MEFRRFPLFILTCLLIFQLSYQLYSPSLKRDKEEGLYYINFRQHLRWFLDDPLFNILVENVRSFLFCARLCLMDARCFSINVAVEPNIEGTFSCQLLNTDKHNSSEKFMASQEFDHYSIASPCDSSPCQHGGTCRALYSTNDYFCDCTVDYNGTNCLVDKRDKASDESHPVCFGARGNSYGVFQVPSTGNVSAFRFVHVSGNVSCNTNAGNQWSKWGCSPNDPKIWIVITDSADKVLLPVEDSTSLYEIPGYHSSSSELVITVPTPPLMVVAGQEFRIWYVEDRSGGGELDNGGTSCTNVYVDYL